VKIVSVKALRCGWLPDIGGQVSVNRLIERALIGIGLNAQDSAGEHRPVDPRKSRGALIWLQEVHSGKTYLSVEISLPAESGNHVKVRQKPVVANSEAIRKSGFTARH